VASNDSDPAGTSPPTTSTGTPPSTPTNPSAPHPTQPTTTAATTNPPLPAEPALAPDPVVAPAAHPAEPSPTPPLARNPTPSPPPHPTDPGARIPAVDPNPSHSPPPIRRRPLIGITSYLERARFGVWDLDAVLLPREYTDSVVRAGGVPVLLPPTGDGFAELVTRLDGLVLAGGADIDPARYDQPVRPETEGLRPDRDAFEFGLLTEALRANLPVLAVCRGMQLLNSALGGTLHQHLPDHVGHAGHRPEVGMFGTCHVTIAGDSRIAGAFGTETKVRCHHHQAVDVVAPGLAVVGTADDGTVEAVELAGGAFVVGVQWHPEQNSGDDRLVAALVREATGRAAR
jgi:putative glutamine amidotransferase